MKYIRNKLLYPGDIFLIAVISILLTAALYGLFGCSAPTGSTSTLGNGKVDAVEAATLRVAVGLAMTARPDTVAPAYAVSTALLAGLSADYVALPQAVDGIIKRETERLNLDPATLASFGDLLLLIRAEITQRISVEAVDDPGKRVMVRELVAIVQETAATRLGIKP